MLVPSGIVLSMIPVAFAISPFLDRFPVLPLVLGLVTFIAAATSIHKTNRRQRDVLRRMSDEYAEWVQRQNS